VLLFGSLNHAIDEGIVLASLGPLPAKKINFCLSIIIRIVLASLGPPGRRGSNV
jgi:hypothetical protein